VVVWLAQNGVTQSHEISASHVQACLSELAVMGLADGIINHHACGIGTMLRFFHSENYIPKLVIFKIQRSLRKSCISCMQKMFKNF